MIASLLWGSWGFVASMARLQDTYPNQICKGETRALPVPWFPGDSKPQGHVSTCTYSRYYPSISLSHSLCDQQFPSTGEPLSGDGRMQDEALREQQRIVGRQVQPNTPRTVKGSPGLRSEAPAVLPTAQSWDLQGSCFPAPSLLFYLGPPMCAPADGHSDLPAT